MLFLLLTDQSVRSSYQPMTSLAYLHDCHSCYNERSIVQKKKSIAERTAWGEWDVEYTLNATKLFWSRSGIMHVAIAWDHEPLLLLATALLPNRTTDSFEREAGPPYDKQRIQMGLRSGNTGVELATSKVH